MSGTRILVFLVAAVSFAQVATAQHHPFLFTLVPPDRSTAPLVLQYDAAYGRGTFEPLGGDNVEQSLGLHARLSDVTTLTGRIGFASTRSSTLSSQHVEILTRVMNGENGLIDLSVGPGYRHEYSGTSVLLARILVGRQFSSWEMYANVLFEKPFAADRDEIDLLLTLGWSYALSASIRLGFEGVGQDLEGFWDEEEAEGGATLFLGPTLVAAIPGTSWSFTLGAGPILRASQNNRVSSAIRDLPVGNGFVVHGNISLAM